MERLNIMMDILEFDVITGKTTSRNFTDEEVTQRETEIKAEKARINKAKAESTVKADARISALAKLAKLGLTEAEIASL